MPIHAAVAALVAAAPVPVLLLDGDGWCRDANAPAARLFDCAVGELVGVAAADLLAIPADGGIAPLSAWWARLDGATGWEGTLEARAGVTVRARAAALPDTGVLVALYLTAAPGLPAVRDDAPSRGTSDVVIREAEGDDGVRLAYASPQLADLIGYSPAEARSEPRFFWNRTHPDDLARLRDAEARALAERAPFRAEYRLRARDGRWVWVRGEAIPVEARGGAEVGWHSVLIDVTEQKAAEEALRASEARFRALTEHGSDLISIFDADGIRRYLTPATERLFGYRPDELVGRPFSAVAHPEDEAAVGAFLARLSAEPNRVERIEHRVVRRDGEVRWLEVIGHNRLDDPSIRGIVTAGRDVTERKHAEAARAAAEARLRSLIDHLPAVVYTSEAADIGRTSFISPQVEALTGYTAADWMSSPERWIDAVHPDDRDRVLAELAAANATGRPFRSDYRFVARDGRVVRVHDEAALVPGEDGGQLWQGFVTDVTDRWRAEAALRENEERYRLLVERLPGIVTVNAADETNAALYASPRVTDVFGDDPADLVADPGLWLARVHADDRDRLLAAIDRANRDGGPFALEYRRFARDGREVWVRDEGVLVRDAAGRPLHWESVVTDITEQRLAEERLRESEERYRALVEQLPLVVALNAPDERESTLYVSPQVEAMLGHPARAFIDDPGLWFALLHPDDRERLLAGIARANTSGVSAATEYRLIRPDGREVWVRDQGLLVHDAHGAPLHWQTVLTDVTEQKRTEAELRAAEAHARTLLDLLPVLVYVEPDGDADRTTYANPKALALFGLDEDRWPGRWFERVHPDDRERVFAENARTDETGEPFRGEYRVRKADGSWIWVRDEAVLVADDPTRGHYWLGVVLDITEQVEAADNLRESEERFRTLVEQLPAVVYLLANDDNQTPLYYSRRIADLLGLSPEEALTRRVHWLELVHPDDRAAVRREEGRTQTGESFRVEYRYRRGDGTWVWVRDECEPVLDAAGRIVAWQGVLLDVSAQHALQDALVAAKEAAEEANRRTQEVLERITDGFYALDRGWRFTHFNEAAGQMLGTSRNEVIGSSVWERFPESVETGIYPAYHRAMTDGVPVAVEFFYEPLAGWFEARAFPTTDGLSVFFRDVTERHVADVALRHQAAQLAAVVAVQAEVAAMPPDPAAVMRLVAERAMALTGAGAACVAIRDGDDEVRYPAAVGYLTGQEHSRSPLHGSLTGACLLTGEAQLSDDALADERSDRRLAGAGGSRSVAVAPLRHDGAVVGALGIFAAEPGIFGDRELYLLQLMAEMVGASLAHAEAFDALVAAKEAAEEASRLKSAFLSTMSHELRTPLNAIIGYAHLLLEGMAGTLTAAQAGDVGQIAGAADRLLALINDLLDLSRIEAGRMDLAMEPVDLAALTERVRALVAPLAGRKGVAVAVEAATGLPPVVGDPDRLRQMLLNLVGNAVKFTERGSVTVALRPEADGGAVEVTVADTGIGIAPEALPHVFDEFRQADSSTTRRYGGTGLGLAIVRRLVDLHGGAIRVESEPAVGSTFTVVLPTAPAENRRTEPSAGAAGGG